MPAFTPLHPMLVHLPLALAMLLPLAGAAALLAGRRGWLAERRVWTVVIALQAALVAGGFVALRSGQSEEDRVERVVSERALSAHEDAAQLFLVGAGITLALALGAGLVPAAGVRRALAAVAVAGMFVVAALALRTGKAGGELVYRHGAASAYAVARADGQGAPTAVGEPEVGESDDDD